MGEGREVVLKTDLEIKEEAKRKAKITGVVISVVSTIIMIIPMIISEYTTKKDLLLVVILFLIIWSLMIAIIIVAAKNILPLVFEQVEYAKRSIAYVNVNLSEKMVEVTPIKDKFLIDMQLKEKATIYANLDDEDDTNVVISIKLDRENSYIEYERINKEYFCDNYIVKEK